MSFSSPTLLPLVIVLLTLSSCSSRSYFGKEGQTASSAGYSCPWGKGSVPSQEHFNDLTINGSGSIDQTTVKGQVTINGFATIEHATLKKNLIVHGAATVKNSTIAERATIYGNVEFDNVKVNDNVTVFGLMRAKKSTLNDIEIHCSECTITLNQCACNNIDIKVDASNHDAPVTLELLDTTIANNITFSNNNGKVLLKGSSSIKGTVQGGTVIK